MREILFRGKRKDNGEWVEGNLVQSKDISVIFPKGALKGKTLFTSTLKENREIELRYEVDPETVCQYTDLTDKNGRKIFEWDIVKAKIKINDFSRDSVKNEINTYEVSYHEKYCYFYLKRKSNNLLFDGNWSYYLKEIEVIGNIFDNPELIGD